MMFRTAILATFFAAFATIDAAKMCYEDYTDLKIEMGTKDCRSNNILKAIRQSFQEKRAESPTTCRGGVNNNDIPALFGVESLDEAKAKIKEMCAVAMVAASQEFGHADWQIDGVNMEDYMEGSGFLNKETGNFENDLGQLEKIKGDISDTFNYVGPDPMQNDHYPTTQESYDAGQRIRLFLEEKAYTTYLNAPTSNLESCAANTVMCCWHRDRQFLDGNGNCNFRDCANQNPGDNTDLCWTETAAGEVFPYPGHAIEKDLHCHGISWTDSETDINTMARWNSLFYVSMYDHLFTRGYVESITNDKKIQGDHQPMCGCIEDMAPVARADCNEVIGKASFVARQVVAGGQFVIEKVDGSFEIEFESCKGYKYDGNFGPDDYLDKDERDVLDKENNDLASFVYKQWLEGSISDAHVETVEKVLVGYRSSLNIKNKDNNREKVCAEAFAKKFDDVPYEVVTVPNNIFSA